jgi:SAM-dependent methyltransferase
MNINQSQAIDHCLISQQPVTKILDFGQHAYADSFIAESQLHLSEPVFPLQVCMNAQSGMIQLGYVSSAPDRYGLYSYSYTSSNSKTARDHWDELANTVKSTLPVGSLVVEIGSNDGYLVGQFVAPGVRAIGIDPSLDMCMIARERGVEIMPAMFCRPVAKDISQRIGKADVIMGNNVFNHANDPVDFARAVADLLSPDGMFIFEVPYWRWMVECGQFTDMVYHEHPIYFTVMMTWNLLQTAGLEIVKFDLVEYHGQSLRVFARLSKGSDMPDQVREAIDSEKQAGIFDPGFYQDLQAKFEHEKHAWLVRFYQLRHAEPNAVIIGVGAAAKANTWLRWHGLDNTVIHCVTDASTHKQGKYTPLTRIPIKSDAVFAEHAQPYALILSWNIGPGLRKAILNINPQTRFISQ